MAYVVGWRRRKFYETAGPFQTAESAERFAASLVASGKLVRDIEIVRQEPRKPAVECEGKTDGH
jgi:hypothetical protein